MPPQTSSAKSKRDVGIMLWLGIFFLPFIFAWFTLRKGHSKLAKISAFVWLGFVLIAMATDSGDEETQEEVPAEVKSGETIESKSEVEASLALQKQVEPASEPEEETVTVEVSEPEIEVTAPDPEFDFSVKEMVVRLNQSLAGLDSDIKFSVKESNDNGEYVTTQLETNKNVAAVVTSSISSKKMTSFMLLASGTGTAESGVDVLFGAAAVVMAFENPKMKADDRGAILKNFGFTDSNVKLEDDVEFEREGIKYSKVYSEQIGLMISASPPK